MSLPDTNFRELLLWLLFRRKHFRVQGNSMLPLLHPGDLILADLRAYRQQSPLPGEIVVAWHPRQPDQKVIKRVKTVHPNGTLDLAGDNPAESTDFDAIASEKILGKVTSKFP